MIFNLSEQRGSGNQVRGSWNHLERCGGMNEQERRGSKKGSGYCRGKPLGFANGFDAGVTTERSQECSLVSALGASLKNGGPT